MDTGWAEDSDFSGVVIAHLVIVPVMFPVSLLNILPSLDRAGRETLGRITMWKEGDEKMV